MSVITYQFRTLGAENARRELLAQAAAARELAKAKRESDRVSAPAARRAGGGADPEVKAAQARTKALAAEARKREATERKAAADIERTKQRATRASEAADKKSAAATARAEQTKIRAAERAQVQQQRAMQRGYQQRVAQAERVSKQMRYRETMAYEARAQGMQQERAARFETLNNVVAGGAVAAGAVGVAATRSYMANQQRSRDLAVGGGAPDQAAALLANAEKTAKSVTGTKTEDVLAGQQKIVAMTGSLELAKSSGRDMATAARATGASEEDIGSLIATLNTKFGMTDPNEIKQAIAMAIQQGKSGAFEMRDAAGYMSEMGAAGQRFGLDKGGSGFAKLGAMAQVARASTGSGAEAATGVQAMMRQLISKSDDIKKMNGGESVVFKDKGKTQTNDIVDVIANTLKATKGNKGKLQEVFGDEGMKGASGFITAFNDAANALGKNATEAERLAAGEAAVRAMFASATNAGSRWGDVVQDAAARTDSSGARMTTAWETIVTAVGSRVAPQLDALSMQAGDIAVVFGELAGIVGDAISAFGSVISLLQKAGIISKDESANRVERLDEIRGEKADLEKSAEAGTLGNAGKKRLKELTKEEGGLVNDLAKEMGLTSGTGGEYTKPMGPEAGPVDLAAQFSNYGYSAKSDQIMNRETERLAQPPKKGIGDYTPAAAVQTLVKDLDTDNGAEQMKAAAGDLTAAAKALASNTARGNPLGAMWNLL